MQIDWQAFKDPDGTLVPIEFNRIPFVPKRIFYVCDIPKDEERGNHAHYETKQLLICVQGEIIVKMHNGRYLESIKLKPNQSVLVDKMISILQTLKCIILIFQGLKLHEDNLQSNFLVQ